MKIENLLILLILFCFFFYGCKTNKVDLQEKSIARHTNDTDYLGTYLGMIAKRSDSTNVMMFSTTSGELLRWIPLQEFSNVYVLKNKSEYPVGK